MTRDPDLAKVFAVQTAVLSQLCEALIETGAVNRDDFVRRLYTLLPKLESEGGATHHAGPIRHLISLLETTDTH